MTSRSVGMALVAGFATFVSVSVAVTDIAYSRIAYSLLVGIPVGILAGMVMTALVFRVAAREASEPKKRGAEAFTLAGTVFLLVLILGAEMLKIGTSISYVFGLLLGILTGTRAYLR